MKQRKEKKGLESKLNATTGRGGEGKKIEENVGCSRKAENQQREKIGELETYICL